MKNLGSVDRVLRVVLGAAVALWALWLFFGGEVLILRLVCLVFVALGLDLVVTGIRGYCPLYKRLGWNTARHEAHA
ncbi:MAG: DUF2892 domain-containing protein [Bacteroidetes bacterium]|nr:DUF2892 domain-containing protein [Bacteroidota bacterium]